MIDEDDDDENIEIDSLDADSDYLIDPISSSPNTIKYGIYRKVKALIEYLNSRKNKSVIEARRWWILSYIAPFYLLIVGEPGLPISPLLAVFLVELVIISAVSLLWFRECYITHRDIAVLYEAGISLEKSYSRLGTSYQNMAKVLHGKFFDPDIINTLYYLLNSIPCHAIAAISLSIFFDWSVTVLILYSFFTLVWAFLLLILAKLSGNGCFKVEDRLERGGFKNYSEKS